jgi:hypothetical protein
MPDEEAALHTGAFTARGRTVSGRRHRWRPSSRLAFAGSVTLWKVIPVGECTLAHSKCRCLPRQHLLGSNLVD